MTPGEIAYLSLVLASFIIFAIVLFAMERFEHRKLAPQRETNPTHRATEGRRGALAA